MCVCWRSFLELFTPRLFLPDGYVGPQQPVNSYSSHAASPAYVSIRCPVFAALAPLSVFEEEGRLAWFVQGDVIQESPHRIIPNRREVPMPAVCKPQWARGPFCQNTQKEAEVNGSGPCMRFTNRVAGHFWDDEVGPLLNYECPPPPHICHKAALREEEGSGWGAYCEDPRSRYFIHSPFCYSPQTLEEYLQGWGCIRFGHVVLCDYTLDVELFEPFQRIEIPCLLA